MKLLNYINLVLSNCPQYKQKHLLPHLDSRKSEHLEKIFRIGGYMSCFISLKWAVLDKYEKVKLKIGKFCIKI